MIASQNNKTYILDEGFLFFRSLSMREVLVGIVLSTWSRDERRV